MCKGSEAGESLARLGSAKRCGVGVGGTQPRPEVRAGRACGQGPRGRWRLTELGGLGSYRGG